MPKFGKSSLERLATCDHRLQEVLHEAIKIVDFSVLCGHRNKHQQNALYPKQSKVQWPNSRHNSTPARAVDVAPYPVDWSDTNRFSFLAGLIIGIGKTKGYTITWGADWDSDGNINEHKFLDFPHFQIED